MGWTHRRDAEREAEEREQRAIGHADGAEMCVVELADELRQVQARAAKLDGATAGLREELGALRAENERLRGIVLR